jgi:hypothetical protein
VPLGDAVRALAELGGLKVVSAGNVLLVTTAERAGQWAADEARRAAADPPKASEPKPGEGQPGKSDRPDEGRDPGPSKR